MTCGLVVAITCTVSILGTCDCVRTYILEDLSTASNVQYSIRTKYIRKHPLKERSNPNSHGSMAPQTRSVMSDRDHCNC
jgi:hypothetical protein